LKSETVLVLQGGGSLGAYECGIYKTLAGHDIKFDTIAGTSIGAVNAAIISSMQRIDSNKTDNNVQILKTVTEHNLTLLKELYEIVSNSKLDEKNKARFKKVEPECNRLAHEHSAIMNEVIHIQRKEEEYFIFEDADFSTAKIKKLVSQGEQDTENALAEKGKRRF
jgi:Patatin-like phospholipase/Patatin phospholipase